MVLIVIMNHDQSLQKETSYIETVADRNIEEYILYVFYILDQV